MKKYLVSGTRGNLGKLFIQNKNNKNYEVLDYEKKNLKSFNRFIHFAAKHPIHTDKQIIESNVLYLCKILRNFNWKNKDFIFLSSISVYDLSIQTISERNKLTKYGLYSLTKIFGEEFIKNLGIASLVLRVPGILSIDKKFSFLSKIIYKLCNNETINLVNGDKKFNSFIDPFDIINFIENQNRLKKFDIINLSAPYTHTLIEITNMFKEALNSSSKIKNIINMNYNTNKILISKAINNYNFSPSKLEDTVERVSNILLNK